METLTIKSQRTPGPGLGGEGRKQGKLTVEADRVLLDLTGRAEMSAFSFPFERLRALRV